MWRFFLFFCLVPLFLPFPCPCPFSLLAFSSLSRKFSFGLGGVGGVVLGVVGGIPDVVGVGMGLWVGDFFGAFEFFNTFHVFVGSFSLVTVFPLPFAPLPVS